jgi:hypothetical protein
MPLLVRFSSTPTTTSSTSGKSQTASARKKPAPRKIVTRASLPFLSASWLIACRRIAFFSEAILRSRKVAYASSLAIALSGLMLLSESTSSVISSLVRCVCRQPALREIRTRKCSDSRLPSPVEARAIGQDTMNATTR